MTDLYYPLRSLREGHWFKLICGASFQDLPAIRSLVLAYTLAGADCIDVAADPAVILTAKMALQRASEMATINDRSPTYGSPWLMVSLSDGEDPHFRKAEFDATACPPDCARPCETICPAQAIVFHTVLSSAASSPQRNSGLQDSALKAKVAMLEPMSGVVSDRCYGCGRCVPICPVQHISTRSYNSTPDVIAPLVLQAGVDAIEIHTQIGRFDAFRQLWRAIMPWLGNLKLIAISCPDGDGLIDYLWSLYDLISPLPCSLLWQTDGRPMSGDIGIGATRAAVKLGQKVLEAGLPGYIQLAGGTNDHTVPKLKTLGLLPPLVAKPGATAIEPQETHFCERQPYYISGVAYGSYARTLLAPILSQLDPLVLEATHSEPSAIAAATADVLPPVGANGLTTVHPIEPAGRSRSAYLEERPTLLWEAVALAHSLVSQLKAFDSRQITRLNL